jgi:hypothetical protein
LPDLARAQVTVRAFTVVPTCSGVLRDLRERAEVA